jgi:hypothetical protein
VSQRLSDALPARVPITNFICTVRRLTRSYARELPPLTAEAAHKSAFSDLTDVLSTRIDQQTVQTSTGSTNISHSQ